MKRFFAGSGLVSAPASDAAEFDRVRSIRDTSDVSTYMSSLGVSAAGSVAAPESREGSVAAPTIVRIAVYDSMSAAPRIEEVFGDSPLELIERLSARTYQVARDAGGAIPYTVIRELTENLVHAGFSGVTVSVMENGAMVRFADSGPGIGDVDRALRPGFSTATLQMRTYIRGVGSGLPIVAECMSFAGGGLEIDRNLGGGAVVTAYIARPREAPGAAREPVHSDAGPSVAPFLPTGGPADESREFTSVETGRAGAAPTSSPGPEDADDEVGALIPRPAPAARRLSNRQKQTLLLVMESGSAGPTNVSRELSVALSTAHRDLAFLQAEGLIAADSSGKRRLTPLGVSYVESLF